MGEIDPVLRIVVVEPRRSPTELCRSSDVVAGVSRLNGDIELELCHDTRGCFALIEQRRIDLVIVDSELAEADTILSRSASAAPPVLLVLREGGEEERVAALRRGAAECVRAGPQLRDLLPGVAMEQIRMARRALGQPAPQPAESHEQSIIQNMNSALVIVDRAGVITSANATAERILGSSPEGIVGRSCWDWWGGDDRRQSMISRTLEDGTPFKGAETRISRGDGQIVPIGISCTPLLGRDGSTLGAVALFQDLSEVKQQRSHALQTEKMASIGQLAAGVAHEINNPMGFIHANLFQLSEYVSDLRSLWTRVGRLQLAAEKGDASELREASEALATASREADIDFLLDDFSKALVECQEGSERIRHIVQDLRDFSHLDTGERMLADINQCVDSTANIVWSMMKHCVELEKDYGELPALSCFPMQIKQVFLNLLMNSYQSIEEVVGSSGEMGRITISTRRQDGGVVVSIRDTGTGIAPEHLGRIFDPFFTTKQVGSGTGLGLSTSYSIVERHAGRLTATSCPDGGSNFEVWLPEDPPED